ncbi:hypothetical protein LTR08_000661 [Meristemomyces frigidus]|nr:hypothetical protein LTR08_000661 [Meristemomyces frigidus]
MNASKSAAAQEAPRGTGSFKQQPWRLPTTQHNTTPKQQQGEQAAKPAARSSAKEQKAPSTKQRHQRGPAGFDERRDAVKEYMDRRRTALQPPIDHGSSLPKFNNIYEYLRFAPEEPMIDAPRAVATPAKQKSRKRRELMPTGKPEWGERLSEGWVTVAPAGLDYTHKLHDGNGKSDGASTWKGSGVPKVNNARRSGVGHIKNASRQPNPMQATCNTAEQRGTGAAVKPAKGAEFDINTEKWPSLSAHLKNLLGVGVGTRPAT